MNKGREKFLEYDMKRRSEPYEEGENERKGAHMQENEGYIRGGDRTLCTGRHLMEIRLLIAVECGDIDV